MCLLILYILFNSNVWEATVDLISEESGKSLKKLRPHYHFETKSLPDHKRKSPQELRFHSKPIRSEENSELNRELGICPRRKNVVILSQGRGGSSFLGGIFNCHPQVMYWFEPLFHVGNVLNVNVFMEKEPISYKDTCFHLVDSILSCDFSNITNAVLSDISTSSFRRHSQALTSDKLCPGKKTSGKCAPLTNSLLGQVCNSYKYSVIKILSGRLPNNSLKSFQEHFVQQNKYDVKFISLVRDPRAVVFSWVKLNWIQGHSNAEFRSNVHRICDSVKKNVLIGLLSPTPWLRNRFKVIRFEDLAIDTSNVAREIYKFVGLDWSVSVDKWINDHRRRKGEKNPYSLFKNASTAISKWKREAPEELIKGVEDVCGDLMNIMGYKKWCKADRGR